LAHVSFPVFVHEIRPLVLRDHTLIAKLAGLKLTSWN
jgi:hypothetical protein